ncbi:Uncharacterised protein [Moraxella caviae]|uniref:Uncharacterized protein n=1 Tax=Moraxella caviae TaxID=34060 RepID=A0A378R827_9GAMM|nr:hypothetical protein [Moraxella caviae]STZ13512.1 Uncharacterised protein [Moraxella caviae]
MLLEDYADMFERYSNVEQQLTAQELQELTDGVRMEVFDVQECKSSHQ